MMGRALLGAALLAFGCSPPQQVPYGGAGGLLVEAPGLYPEGVAYDPATGGFFVGSLRNGTVGRVTPGGAYEPFAEAGPLVSTLGLAADPARGRLLAVGGDLGVGARSAPGTAARRAGMAVYDLTTGALIRFVPLGPLRTGRRLANDLSLDAHGNAYVTDSFAGVIYRVTPEGEPSVFAADAAFASGEVGLNGIAVHPEGFLLVAHFTRGALYRIPLSDPGHVAEVALPEALVGADGLALLDARTLVLVQNEGADRALLLRSGDGWRSATIAAAVPSTLPFPTTATRAGDAVYVLNAQLDALFDGDDATNADAFVLQRVAF